MRYYKSMTPIEKHTQKTAKKEEKNLDHTLRKALAGYLARPHTHAPFEKVVEGMSEKAMTATIPHVPHSPWMLLEHIRITAHDMLNFVEDPDYESMQWPEEYWPSKDERPTAAMWRKSAEAFLRDLRAFEAIIKDDTRDLFERIPWGEGQTIFVEVLQMIDHASYHMGELVLLRRALGEWKD